MVVSTDLAPIQTDLLKHIATALQNGAQTGQLGVVQGRAYWFVMLPVRISGQPNWLLLGFASDTRLAEELLQLWMFDEAARQWAGLQLPDQALHLSVNLSTRDLLDPDFPARLDLLLAKHGVAPEGFCLEITESAIMDDPLRAESTLNRLSERSFKLSIDDFGTGYSSLAYLKRLPVDELKIDKSFVIGMERDPDNAKIVRSTIDLAHNMGLSVVAEGVENLAIWHLLRAQNCDQAQGYYMGKPMPVEAFKSWRDRWAERAEV